MLAAFKSFLETCDCVSGAQLCCRELTCVTVCLIKGLRGKEGRRCVIEFFLVFLFLNEKNVDKMFLTMILKSSKTRVLGRVLLMSQQGLARSFPES